MPAFDAAVPPGHDLDIDLLVEVRHRARADAGALERFRNIFHAPDRNARQVHLDQQFLDQALVPTVAFNNCRSTSASSMAFSASSTVPRTISPRWPRIRASSILDDLVHCLLVTHRCPFIILEETLNPESAKNSVRYREFPATEKKNREFFRFEPDRESEATILWEISRDQMQVTDRSDKPTYPTRRCSQESAMPSAPRQMELGHLPTSLANS